MKRARVRSVRTIAAEVAAVTETATSFSDMPADGINGI
jgi:hypothetical protein